MNTSRNSRKITQYAVRLIQLTALLAAALLLVHSVCATTYDWTGTTNGNMSGTTTNYSPNGTPGSSDVIRWNAATYTTAPTANANIGIGELLFDSGNTGGVTFGSGANTLTLSGISSIGIQLNAGTGAVSTGSAKFALGASQSWLNNSANSFTVGGTINLGGFALTIDGSGATALNGIISNGSLTKTGAGTLTLTGVNTYTGGTTISAGTIKVNNAKALGDNTSAVSVTSGAVLDVNGITMTNTNALTLNGTGINSGGALISGTGTGTYAGTVALGSDSSMGGAGSLTVSNVVSGAFNLAKVGAGTLTLNGANTFGAAKTFTISAGTVKVGNATALGDSTGAVSVTSGAVLDLNGTTMTNTNALTLNGTGISSGGALTNSSATAGVYAGLVTLGSDSSIIASGNGGITLSNTGTITGSGLNLTVGGAKNTTIASIIGTGAGGLTKQDAGTLTLSATNTYTGSTTITGGTLQLDGSTAAGSQVNVGTAGTLTGSGTVNGNATLTGSGVINKSSGVIAGTLAVTGGNWNGAGSVTGLVTSSSGTFTIGSGANLTANGGLNVTGGTLTVNGLINSGSALALGGNGIFNFSGAAAATETFASFNANQGFGTVNNTVSGTTLNLGAVTHSAGGMVYFGNTTGTIASTTNTNGIIGPWAFLGAGTTLDYAVANGANVAISSLGAATTLPTSVGASGTNYTLAGAQTQSANTVGNTLRYTGGAQTLALGTTSLGLSGLMNAGGGLLTITGTALNPGLVTTGELDIATNTQGITISSVISGAGSVVSGGVGTTVAVSATPATGLVTLSGANTYSGGTVINSGALRASNNTALGTTDVTVTNGAQLQVNAGVTIGNTININGSSSLFSAGNGTSTLSGIVNLQSNSGIALNTSGGNAAMTLSGTLNLNGFTLSANTQNINPAITISAVINGSGGITQAGAGILLISNNNSGTYSGTTTVSGNGSILQLGNDGALGSGSFALGGNGFTNTVLSLGTATRTLSNTLVLGGNSTSIYTFGAAATNTGNLIFTNTTAIALSSVRTFNVLNSQTQFAAAFTGASGAITKSGVGTLVLNGTASSYAGVTTISASGGTLAVAKLADGGSNSSIGSSSNAGGNLLIGNSATLQYTGSGDSTDRRFTMNSTAAGSTATLDASGTGAINFTNTATPLYGDQTSARTLILTGTNTGANTLAANIADGSSGGVVSLTKNGAGAWSLTGTSTYTGATTISGGSLVVGANAPSGSAGALGNTTSAVTLGDAATTTNNSSAALLAGGAFTIGRAVTVANQATTGTYTIGGSNTSGTAQYTGNMTLNKAVTLTAANGGTVDFNTGTWTTNNNAVNVTGAGTSAVKISNALVTSGGVNVKSGTLLVAGSISGSAVTVGDSNSLSTAAILGGTGTVGDVTVGTASNNSGATLDPGNVGSIGALTTGNLAFAGSGVHLAIQLGATAANGNPAAGTNNDVVNTTGTVTLAGADLVLTLNGGFAPSGDNLYLIINNSSSQSGGIANLGQLSFGGGALAQGDFFTVGGQAFQISYTADFSSGRSFTGGNDVALLAVPEPGTWGILVGGFGMLLGLQRSRRRR